MATYYTPDHLWVQFLSPRRVRIGITAVGQKTLGTVAFLNLCDDDDSLRAGEAFGDVETDKRVTELLCPLSGQVCCTNPAVLDRPGLINTAPQDSWLIELRLDAAPRKGTLLSAKAYQPLCK